MPNNWKTYKLIEVSELITKGTTPSTYGYNFIDEGVNYIKSDSTSYDGSLDSSVFVSISEEAHEKLKRSQLKEYDILFSIAGAYLGKSGMVKKRHLPANTNQANAIIRIDKKLALPKFVNLLLRNPKLVHYVNASSGQSAQPNLNLTDLGNLEFNIPDLKEQTQIANILSAIDDKIENNLAINKTLEDMAMALYKHWFVDFKPFQEGEFVNSELGLIPKGWEVKKIKDFGKIICGKTPSKKEPEYYSSKSYPFIKIPDMHGNVWVLNTNEGLTKRGNQSQKNKLLPVGSVNVSCIATVGLVSMNIKPSHTNQQINSIIPKNIEYRYYLYLSMINLKGTFLNEASGGSATLNMNTTTFSNIELIKPSNEVLSNFYNAIHTYFENIKINQTENQTLTKLRDTLLPKLISGEVRLKEFREGIDVEINSA
jgi:type I restriction enzyme S subunit